MGSQKGLGESVMRAKRSGFFWSGWLLCLCLLPSRASPIGEDETLPSDILVRVLFKCLTMEQNLKVRCPEMVRIGVLALVTNQDSLAAAMTIHKTILSHQNKTISGLSIHAEILAVRTDKEVMEQVDARGLNILFLAPKIDSILDPVLRFGKVKRLLMITGEAGYVQKGASLGAVLRDKKPKILISQSGSSAQAARWDEKLLGAAEIIADSP